MIKNERKGREQLFKKDSKIEKVRKLYQKPIPIPIPIPMASGASERAQRAKRAKRSRL